MDASNCTTRKMEKEEAISLVEESTQEIGWRKVRSIRKVECESRAMPVWGVVVIVVVLVGIMAVGAVFGFKKYREYGRVNTEGDSSVI